MTYMLSFLETYRFGANGIDWLFLFAGACFVVGTLIATIEEN